MANGVTPVEPNPDFLEDVRKAAGGKGVILACEGGGTTEPTPSFQWVSMLSQHGHLQPASLQSLLAARLSASKTECSHWLQQA